MHRSRSILYSAILVPYRKVTLCHYRLHSSGDKVRRKIFYAQLYTQQTLTAAFCLCFAFDFYEADDPFVANLVIYSSLINLVYPYRPFPICFFRQFFGKTHHSVPLQERCRFHDFTLQFTIICSVPGRPQTQVVWFQVVLYCTQPRLSRTTAR